MRVPQAAPTPELQAPTEVLEDLLAATQRYLKAGRQLKVLLDEVDGLEAEHHASAVEVDELLRRCQAEGIELPFVGLHPCPACGARHVGACWVKEG